MEWIQVTSIIISVVGSVVGSVVYIHKDSKAYLSQIQEDRRQQTYRTDKLYEMFIDLLKNKNAP